MITLLNKEIPMIKKIELNSIATYNHSEIIPKKINYMVEMEQAKRLFQIF